ncbi:MAG: hypothetical protein ACM358_10370 [Gemmatimonadota bacterium]
MKIRGSVLCLVLLLATAVPTVAADREKILDFDTMVGVSGPFKGAVNPINGVNGGGLAWTIDVGRGRLRADGELTIAVRGLVFAEGPNVGRNTVPGFRGLVSCHTLDTTGAAVIVNVSTDVFAATTAGDADIRADVELPEPCIAPIVFVTSPAGAWFATTGF